MTEKPEVNEAKSNTYGSFRLSVAPPMDWTDRHCRFFHRQMTRRAMLYTEMVIAPAIVHGPKPRLLDFSAAEHPVALQLGGSDPDDLARATALSRPWGYDEVNLKCGCPSDRVQSGCFGAVLMQNPGLVARCVAAMIAEAAVPVTVKCRIGVDDQDPAEILPRFIETVAGGGVTDFDLCFLGINAIDTEHGITDNDWVVVQLKQSMIASSQKVVCLTIAEKINTLQPIHVAALSKIDILITDLPNDHPSLQPYVSAGINVI